jgi:hypothetical protein
VRFEIISRPQTPNGIFGQATCRARLRQDQQARGLGGWTTSLKTRRAFCGSSVEGRPGRGASCSPATPKSRNLWRHRPPVTWLVSHFSAITQVAYPSLASSATRARRTSCWGVAGPLTKRGSSLRCRAVRVSDNFGRAMCREWHTV